MLNKSYKQKLIELFYITGYKRIKAGELNNKIEFMELSQSKDYIEDTIAKEFNLRWNS